MKATRPLSIGMAFAFLTLSPGCVGSHSEVPLDFLGCEEYGDNLKPLATEPDQIPFRLSNRSSTEFYVDLFDDLEGYWTEYPAVEISIKSEIWMPIIYNPGQWDGSDMVRVRLSPEEELQFDLRIDPELRAASANKTFRIAVALYDTKLSRKPSKCVYSSPFEL
jgi:hypothetical protein